MLTLVPAQHPFIEDFQVSQISGGVFVQWTLKQGSICQGIQIERRSGQEPTYTEVGNIEGVCGNVTEPESFSFLDTRPSFGEENHYRLVLGGNGATEDRTLFVHDYQNQEYVVLQDPYQQFIRLLPRRAGTGDRYYHIYSAMGAEFGQGALVKNTVTSISTAALAPGVYLIQVIETGEVIFSSSFLKSN